MTLLNSPTRYGALGQTLHWLTVLFVGAAYLLGEGGPESRIYAPERASTLTLHETCGMIVLGLLVLRLVWRLLDRAPEEPPMPAWMLFSARLVHWVLYALLAALPLTAISGAWLEGHAVTFLGIGPIGPFLAPAHDLGHSISEIHETLGNVIVWIAGLHAAAALYHHFVLRDRVLLAMLPVGRADAPR
jgi:cytochrome b561